MCDIQSLKTEKCITKDRKGAVNQDGGGGSYGDGEDGRGGSS